MEGRGRVVVCGGHSRKVDKKPKPWGGEEPALGAGRTALQAEGMSRARLCKWLRKA